MCSSGLPHNHFRPVKVPIPLTTPASHTRRVRTAMGAWDWSEPNPTLPLTDRNRFWSVTFLISHASTASKTLRCGATYGSLLSFLQETCTYEFYFFVGDLRFKRCTRQAHDNGSKMTCPRGIRRLPIRTRNIRFRMRARLPTHYRPFFQNIMFKYVCAIPFFMNEKDSDPSRVLLKPVAIGPGSDTPAPPASKTVNELCLLKIHVPTTFFYEWERFWSVPRLIRRLIKTGCMGATQIFEISWTLNMKCQSHFEQRSESVSVGRLIHGQAPTDN